MEVFICRYPLKGICTRNGHQTLETALINQKSSISIMPYHTPECLPPPPDNITTHKDVLKQPCSMYCCPYPDHALLLEEFSCSSMVGVY